MNIKKVINYENLYKVSDTGKIFSCQRKVKVIKPNKTYFIPVKGREIKYWKNKQNYPMVSLCKDGKIEKIRVNRLVATTFILNPQNLPIVMHKDNNPENNYVSNLKWGTYSENSQQAFSEGRMRNTFTTERTKGEKNIHAKLKKIDILEIRNSLLTSQELSKKFNVSRNNIWMIKTNKIWNFHI